ncbi:MAG: hypothetical protein ABFC77_09185 [Thermoguttaceae bacterium]
MRAFYLAIAAAILAVGVTAITAQERAAENVGQGKAAMDRAAATQKYVFLFFWKDKNSQTEKAWSVLESAMTKFADSAEVASIQITNPSEKKIVDQFGASRAPMPLVLAIAPCGAVTKAFIKTFDEKQLRTAFVSSCTQQCLKALRDRKLVFVCVVDKDNVQDAMAIPRGVKDFKADAKFGPATEIVLVNAQDKNEATFLNEIEVGVNAEKPVTVFFAPPGVLVGRFGGAATKEALVAKLAAAQSNPCAGGKCGPGGCGPKKK